MSDFLPFWFQLKPGFYKKLKQLADEAGESMPETLRAALKALEQSRKAAEANEAKGSAASAGNASPASLSSYRWSRIPKEERQKIARGLAQKRWAGKQSPKDAA